MLNHYLVVKSVSISHHDNVNTAAAGLEILVASIEAAQSLDADVLAAQLSSRSFATFYANLTFDDNHQGVLDLLVRQVTNLLIS